MGINAMNYPTLMTMMYDRQDNKVELFFPISFMSNNSYIDFGNNFDKVYKEIILTEDKRELTKSITKTFAYKDILYALYTTCGAMPDTCGIEAVYPAGVYPINTCINIFEEDLPVFALLRATIEFKSSEYMQKFEDVFTKVNDELEEDDPYYYKLQNYISKDNDMSILAGVLAGVFNLACANVYYFTRQIFIASGYTNPGDFFLDNFTRFKPDTKWLIHDYDNMDLFDAYFEDIMQRKPAKFISDMILKLTGKSYLTNLITLKDPKDSKFSEDGRLTVGFGIDNMILNSYITPTTLIESAYALLNTDKDYETALSDIDNLIAFIEFMIYRYVNDPNGSLYTKIYIVADLKKLILIIKARLCIDRPNKKSGLVIDNKPESIKISNQEIPVYNSIKELADKLIEEEDIKNKYIEDEGEEISCSSIIDMVNDIASGKSVY